MTSALSTRPYLVIPFFVEQPTWGGSYIVKTKGWSNHPDLVNKKIGQSYELYSGTRLAASITSTEDPQLTADSAGSEPQKDSYLITELYQGPPLPLIKFTQAKGNSFQLHRKPNVPDSKWSPKAESWYYFEEGKITFGLKDGADLNKYKKSCKDIEQYMIRLSERVRTKQIEYRTAMEEARGYIEDKNPWQYVNVHYVPKDGVVDLSGGGLHHSWETDEKRCPLGNVLYEIQQDVMDPVSTIRSFDQGKMMSDGAIRSIDIDDYFKHIDTDTVRNTLSLTQKNQGLLFDSPYYRLKKMEINALVELNTNKTFHHLFVENGKIIVTGGGVTLTISRGHSCFVPPDNRYEIKGETSATILLTYI